jgi:hypothetical protein
MIPPIALRYNSRWFDLEPKAADWKRKGVGLFQVEAA